MLNNIKQIIKKKLQHYLGVDNIRNELNKTQTQLHRLEDRFCERLSEIEKLVDVGVDVHMRGGSWGVLALKGKSHNYVKFIDLKDSDMRDVSHFLKRFERYNCINDAPHRFDFRL